MLLALFVTPSRREFPTWQITVRAPEIRRARESTHPFFISAMTSTCTLHMQLRIKLH